MTSICLHGVHLHTPLAPCGPLAAVCSTHTLLPSFMFLPIFDTPKSPVVSGSLHSHYELPPNPYHSAIKKKTKTNHLCGYNIDILFQSLTAHLNNFRWSSKKDQRVLQFSLEINEKKNIYIYWPP